MKTQLLAAVLGALSIGAAQAADAYPSRPVKIIVPFAPGSSTDGLARVVGERLSKTLGQPFTVENRPGAGGAIGTGVGAKAAPDGYTLTMAGSGPFGINPAIYLKLPYDAKKDFIPIVDIANTPQVLVTSATGPYTSLKKVLEAKATGHPIDYASIGVGSTSHMAGQYFQSMSGVPLTHIPFKGNGDAQMQLIGNLVPLMFDALPGVIGSVKSGKLRALGIAAPERSPLAPDIPTFREQGLPLTVTGWIGLAAPAGTPIAIVDKLNREINQALKDPEFIERMASLAFMPVGGSRAEFEAFIASEIATWSKVAKEAHVQMDGDK
jgi:tripartite-type tricarboxylate transporter receptor subunit TctC